jgi:hypothetical protein
VGEVEVRGAWAEDGWVLRGVRMPGVRAESGWSVGEVRGVRAGSGWVGYQGAGKDGQPAGMDSVGMDSIGMDLVGMGVVGTDSVDTESVGIDLGGMVTVSMGSDGVHFVESAA